MDYAEVRRQFPKGEHIVISGPRSSGKTTVALGLYSQLTALGKVVALETPFRPHRKSVGEGFVRDVTIWDTVEVPPHVTNNPLTRYITCGPIL